MKKTSLFKKILSIVLSLTIVFSVMAIASPHTHAADGIEFLMDGDKRVGIKKIVIDGKTYYDVDDGKSTIDPTEVSPVDLYKKAMLADYNGYSAVDLWANVASQIYKSAGKGIGWNPEKSFDTNLVEAFGKSDSYIKDNLVTTGWTVGTTLKTAQDKMVSEFVREFGDSVELDDFLNNTTGKTEGLDFFNTDAAKANQTVLYNIASNGTSSAYTRYYQAYGIVFYDFMFTPLADDDLEFITAAEGYDSLEEAEAANIPGVEYNTTGGGTPNTSYISNPSSSDSVVSAMYSETSSTSVSNTMESSKTYTFGQSTEVSTEFGASFPLVADARMSVSVGFTAEEAISTAYGEEKSVSKEVTTETVAEVNLPAHTQIGITQQSGSTEIVLTYDCPVYLTYKVAIFGMNAEFYWDHITGGDTWSTVDYDQGSICIPFGTDTTVGGLTAVDNIYNRAILYRDMAGFEESYSNNFGRFEHQGDGDGAKGLSAIDWNGFINTKADGSNITTLDVINRLYKGVPLSASGAKMTIKSTSQNTDITQIVPLYDLDFTQVDGNSVFTVAPGGTVDLSKINTLGYNEYNVPYYGYIGDAGEWILCDEQGNEIQDNADVTLTTVADSYQKLTANKEGTYYAKFVIESDLYDDTTNDDLSSSATITVNATETGLDHVCSEGPWETTIPATCTTEGEQVAKCAVCSRVMYTQTVEKLAHTPVETQTPATCQAEGKITTICGECFGLISSITISKLPHVPGAWVTTTDETCTTEGEKQQSCTECQTLIATEKIPPHEHFAGDWIITREANCETAGEKAQLCTVCNGIIKTESIDAHGHAAYWITAKEATCKDAGREEYVCSICNSVLETKEIAKTEHVPGKWEITKDSSCTQSGLMQQTCANCSALLGEPKVIDPHEHQLGNWVTVIEAGCENEGEKIRVCTICNGTIESEKIAALGHTEGVWVTSLEATCETQGEQHKTCTRCGILIESKRLEALGHVPGPAMTCVTDQVCLVCEEVLIPADGRSHVWTEWATYEEAKFFTEEKQRRECSSCYIEEYRYIKGTSKCHKYFPHCDGSGEDCWACETLSNTNGFFRNLGKFLTWVFFENIFTNILFPFTHDHFHENINLDEMFGS